MDRAHQAIHGADPFTTVGTKPMFGDEPDVSGALGTVTADELPSGAPPAMLAEGWLHPEEGTGIYGKGGTGKGITSAYLAGLLAFEGERVLIVDFENHPREWGTRLAALGLGADVVKSIHYVSPYGQTWEASIGSFDKVAGQLRAECDRLDITYLIIDSYTSSSDAGSSEALGGQEAAQLFAKAAQSIGRPYLLLAHVNGAANRHPERPFGSVHVHNLCFRFSWSVEEHEAPTRADPDDPTRPATVTLEFRNQKHNDQPKADDRVLSFAFYVNGDMTVLERTNAKRQVLDMVVAALIDTPLLTTAQVRKAIRDRYEQDVPEDSIRKAISRDSGKRVSTNMDKVPYRYEAATA
jgi:hypothetical protein